MKQAYAQQKVLKIPPSLSPFIDIFTATSPKDARLLFEEAVKALYPMNSGIKFKRTDLKLAFHLICDMNPKSHLEIVLCAQFIVAHLIGMQKLSQGYFKDKRVGVKLLKLSNGSLSKYCEIAR